MQNVKFPSLFVSEKEKKRKKNEKEILFCLHSFLILSRCIIDIQLYKYNYVSCFVKRIVCFGRQQLFIIVVKYVCVTTPELNTCSASNFSNDPIFEERNERKASLFVCRRPCLYNLVVAGVVYL